jgi:hypothetical protein
VTVYDLGAQHLGNVSVCLSDISVYVRSCMVYLPTGLRDAEANLLLDKLQVLNSIVDDHEVCS